MTTLTENDVLVKVFTRREGLASPFAHDLEIRAQRVSCALNKCESGPFAIDARIDARRLRVRCAVTGMREDNGVLSLADKEKINAHILQDVLHVDANPEIRFVSSRVVEHAAGIDVSGDLTLNGCTRQVSFSARRVAKHLVATVSLHQPDYGIKLYAAPLGLMRVKPDVLVEVTLPAELGLLV